MGNETGSFSSTLLGSILGYLGGWGGVAIASALAGEEGEDVASVLGIVVFLAGSPIGATIGFNTTRRYKSPLASGTALINFSDGQTSLAVPTLSFRPEPYVNLVKVRF